MMIDIDLGSAYRRNGATRRHYIECTFPPGFRVIGLRYLHHRLDLAGRPLKSAGKVFQRKTAGDHPRQ